MNTVIAIFINLIWFAVALLALGLVVRLVCACYSPEIRRRIKARPVVHAVWIVFALVFTCFYIVSLRSSIRPPPGTAQIATTRTQLANFREALRLYAADCNVYPTEKQGLQALLTDPGVSGWHGPYMKGHLPTDSWGKTIRYSLSNDHVRITAAGRDKLYDTRDDIEEKW